MNYNTKFSLNEKVEIVSGLHKGRYGHITDYIPQLTRGLIEDAYQRGETLNSGMYSVKLNFFTWVYVREEHLEKYS